MSKSTKLYKAAFFLGLIPFLVGVLITFAWMFIQTKLLEEACLWILLVGLWALGIGTLTLIAYIVVAKKANHKHILKNSLKIILSYLAEIIVAFVLLMVAINILTVSSVVFVNKSDYPISQIVLTNGDKQYHIDDLSPHSQRKIKLDFDRDGSLEYSLNIDGTNKKGILFGYVCSNIGIEGTIRINQNKSILAFELYDDNESKGDQL
jgi:hypothetical protein